MTAALLRERHNRGTGHTGPFLGCPACIDDGVYLCPGCLEPGPGVNGRGRHTGCVELWRWAVFALYAVCAAGVVFCVIAVVAAFPVFFAGVLVLGLLVLLGWPHRVWMRGLLPW